MKASGGPVRGEFVVGRVEFWQDSVAVNLQPLASAYSLAIRADADPCFWESREGSRYVTLMHVRDVKRYAKPYSYPKRDRRGWIVIGADTTT